MPPLLPQFNASDSPWQQMSMDGARYVSALTSYTPSSEPLSSDASCTLCGMFVKSGLPMCYHWRMLHPHALCSMGYVARGGFLSAAAAVDWLDALLAPFGCRLSTRGGSLTRSPRGCVLTLRCACLMIGRREEEAARASLGRAHRAASIQAAAAAAATAATAFTTDVAGSLRLQRTLGGAGSSALATRTVKCCHASARIADGGSSIYHLEYFHLHGHPMRAHHALSPQRPGALFRIRRPAGPQSRLRQSLQFASACICQQ